MKINIVLSSHEPILGIVGYLPRVACAGVRGGDLVRGEINVKQIVHVFHDRHVCVQKD